jgi:Flp pilus assembly protein TadG
MMASIPLFRHCVSATRFAISRFRRHARAFEENRSGNVAIIFALTVIPIFGAAAVAVDYSRANAARTAMQAALDTTALMVSKESLNITTTQVQNKGQKYFNAQFSYPDVKNVTITFTLQNNGPGDFTVIAEAAGTIRTSIAQVIGIKKLNIRADTQVRFGFKALELALALDNTGSMAQKNKMTELKSAVTLLLATLKKNSKVQDDTKVAIIPFNTVVNVGTGYSSAPWVAYDSTTTQTNWTGCVADRDQPNDVKDTTPTGALPTMYPVAASCGSLAQAIPLTSDWDALNAMVSTMTPTGNTNVTIGMAWAWSALTSSEPFTQAQAVKPDVEKVMILLTDGLNTQNRFTSVPSQIDTRTATVCDNIKKAGIRLYTVRVIEGNLSLLQGCASAPNMFYDVQVASDLTSVFGSIAATLSGARLSK